MALWEGRPLCGQIDASENITIPQLLFVGGGGEVITNTLLRRIDVDVDPPPIVTLPGSLTFYVVQ